MKNAIARSWAEVDAIRGCDQAAAALAAVEESMFVIGSSTMRALQCCSVIVAVVLMNRCCLPSSDAIALHLSHLFEQCCCCR
jgi:hypothetical protein